MAAREPVDLRAAGGGMSGPFDVAILAGGEGTRLKARAGPLPKALVGVGGAPLIEHQIALCRLHGFTRILLLVHHGHDVMQARLGDGSAYGVTLGYRIEPTPRGTAGAVFDALPALADRFLILFGDTYLDVDLRRLWTTHVERGASVTLFVHPNDHPNDSDLVEVDAGGYVMALHPHPHDPGQDYRNLVNAALCAVEARALQASVPPHGKVDLARDTVPALLAAGERVYGYRSPEYIKDMGTPARLDQVTRDVEAGVPDRLSGRGLRPAVFLDRDGTLNREVHRLTTRNQVELLDGAGEAVRRLNRSGTLAVVVTNQPVLARGDTTNEELEAIHRRLDAQLGRAGAYLDALYVCPHHPDAGFPGERPELKRACTCRKPATGLVDAACRDLLIDRRASWMVGDTTSDVETGRRAGLRTVLLRSGHAGQDGRFPFRPDYVVTDLRGAVAWILDGHRAVMRQMIPAAHAALNTRLVLIGGQARAGKSSAAQVLKEIMTAFGRAAHVLSLDSWLKPQEIRREGAGVLSRFDVAAVVPFVAALLDAPTRRTARLPIYDRARRAMYERPAEMSIGPDDLVILEGVAALLVDPLLARAGVRIHVEAPEDERLARLREDYGWRGEPAAAVDALIASRDVDERRPIEGARARADFVVSGWTAA